MHNDSQNNSDPQNRDDERIQDIARLRTRIKVNKDRLHQRQLQAAKYGISVEPVIVIEIEELTREIAQLEQQLKVLGG